MDNQCNLRAKHCTVQETVFLTTNDSEQISTHESSSHFEEPSLPIPTPPAPTNLLPTTPWQFCGTDVADAFHKYKLSLNEETANSSIESSIHEVLALSNILLLCRNQNSEHMMRFIPERVLNSLYDTLLRECLDATISWSDSEFLNVARILDDISFHTKAKPLAEFELMTMAIGLDDLKRSVIVGLFSVLKKLPTHAIKAQSSIGECELWNTYFDPILSNILADPEKNILLRWTNITCDGTMNKRPSATISSVNQLEFGK